MKNALTMTTNLFHWLTVGAGLLLSLGHLSDALGQPGINSGKPIITFNTTGPVSIQTQSPPSFPGGEVKLKALVLTSLAEAESPIRLGRKTWLTASLDKDGKVTSLEPTYDTNPALARAMERIARLMPRWQPGLINGKGVETQCQFLIRR